MKEKTKVKLALLIGFGLLVLAGGGTVARATVLKPGNSKPPTNSGGGNSPGTGGTNSPGTGGGNSTNPQSCIYPNTSLPAPLKKVTRNELIYRVHQRILEANPGLEGIKQGEITAAMHMAGEIVTACYDFQVPIDFACAIAWRESRFNLHLDDVAGALNRGGANGFGKGSEIGPFQVKPGVFKDVKYDATKLLSMKLYARITLAVKAGVDYISKIKYLYRKNESWCEIAYCYTEGPTGSRLKENRDRKASYVADVTARAVEYSELRR